MTETSSGEDADDAASDEVTLDDVVQDDPGQDDTTADETAEKSAGQQWMDLTKRAVMATAGTALTLVLVQAFTGAFAPIRWNIEDILGAAPVDITATRLDECAPRFVPDSVPGTPPPVGDREAFDVWQAAHSTADSGATRVLLNAQGRNGRAVTLQRIRIITGSVRPAAPGRSYHPSCEKAGPSTMQWLYLDLDAPEPVASRPSKAVRERMRIEGRAKPAQFPYTVKQDDVVTFVLTAEAVRSDVVWTAKIDWISDGRTGSTDIRLDGRPFHTMGNAHTAVHVPGVPPVSWRQQVEEGPENGHEDRR
ncbi:hypothetical protein HII36_13415 [Nonomuraea sp. NN258]|uniref:hypothetical protein n=1 Tax=Nonomuraea antri TaxID=2730852 RepID=UPI001568E42A|nr:hypothetical protein [Nonomuraea antri]NRQ32832.1 hypothetical protein [Nonomuraea antri]